jgi:hypothetical protein
LDAVAISVRNSATRRSRMIFVVSDKIFGGGTAVECTFDGLVPEKVSGTFPLLFILFLLFSLGELGTLGE